MTIRDLRNKRVLVTGAASGIGFETALAFARAGAALFVMDLNAGGLDQLASEVRALGSDCRAFVSDVANEQAVLDVAAQIHAVGGPLDVLVNNAGIAFLGSFLETPQSAWQRVLNVNVLGMVNGCRAFIPEMLRAGSPRHVVNVASAAGLAPACSMSAYAASKHAVIGATETLSMELDGSAVGITVVCPGIINTPIVRPSSSSVGPSITQEQLDRLASYYRTKGAHPRAVAEAIVDAVRTGRALVLVGPYARTIYHLRRLSRTLLRRILIADSKKMGWI